MRALVRTLPRLVARIPAAVHTKLLVAFLIIVGLLIALGGVGLEVLGEVNRRSEDLVKLQRKIAAYRQMQHDTTAQLDSVAAALLVPEDRSLDAILRQLNQFGYDLDRLQFVARDEVELLGRVRADYDEFIRVVTRVVELIRSGRVAEGRELQLARATPLADRLERLTNPLVNQAEADMVASVDTSHAAFVRARWGRSSDLPLEPPAWPWCWGSPSRGRSSGRGPPWTPASGRSRPRPSPGASTSRTASIRA